MSVDFWCDFVLCVGIRHWRRHRAKTRVWTKCLDCFEEIAADRANGGGRLHGYAVVSVEAVLSVEVEVALSRGHCG
jgi:hypothetical protein